ncbi:hypothetical protein chiPu_0024318, partial [Chiloscyllium punctatum]|nr:hypothetical protein [Chiloscyllium punctatum]
MPRKVPPVTLGVGSPGVQGWLVAPDQPPSSRWGSGRRPRATSRRRVRDRWRTPGTTRTLSAVTFESQVPPANLHLIPLEELREFAEENRAQLALDRWSSSEKVYWSAHAARQAPGLDVNERKRVRNFLGALL